MAQPESALTTNTVWRFFSSVKLTLVLLIILAVVSIIGTVIPQQEGVEQFARTLSPGMLRIYNVFDLFDMYHSTWFRVILGFLTLNLLICSLDRFPGTWKLFKTKPKPDRLKIFKNLPPERSFTVEGKLDDAADSTFELLNAHFKKIRTKKSPTDAFFYGEKGRYSYFGVYLVHFSILFILIGAIVGSLWGLDGYVNIPEGGAVNTISLREGNASKGLGFSVHLDKFTVEFYDSGAPKEFQSDLRFLAGNQEIVKGGLRVNHPMTVRGITFYQSSYGTIPGESVRLKFSRAGSNQEVSTTIAKKGNPIKLPGDEGQFEVVQIEKNLRGMMGPAVMISIKSKTSKELKFWVFQGFDRLKKRFPPAMLQSTFLNPSAFKPYTFMLEGIESKYFTGLQVAKDPGVPLVWLGFFMMIIGFFIAFFSSHKRIWVRISSQDKKLKISIAGRSNKNPIGLEGELDRVTKRLHNSFFAEG